MERWRSFLGATVLLSLHHCPGNEWLANHFLIFLILRLLVAVLVYFVIILLGTSEAFLHAIGTEDQLKRSNDMLLVFSLVYITLNILLIRSAGAIGLILANSLSILHPFINVDSAIILNFFRSFWSS